MKFTFPIADMIRTLNVLGKVIQKQTMLPILSNVMISKPNPKEELYFLTGGTAESMMTVQVNISMIDGSEFKPVCIPHAQFLQVLSALPEQPITVDVDDTTKTVKVLYEGGEFTFAGCPSNEYPQMSSQKIPLVKIAIPTDILLPCMINASLASAKKDVLRPVICSVYLDVKADGVTFVGTDGHNLLRYEWEHGLPFIKEGQPTGVVVPNACVPAISAAFDKAKEVSFTFDGTLCTFVSDTTTFVFRTLEYKYPNYNSVITKGKPYHITLGVARLKQSLHRVAMMANEANHLVKLTKTEAGLQLEAIDIDFARSAVETIPLSDDCVLPDGFMTGIKSSSMLNMLSPIASDNVVIKFISDERAITLTEEGNSALTVMIMPMVVS